MLMRYRDRPDGEKKAIYLSLSLFPTLFWIPKT